MPSSVLETVSTFYEACIIPPAEEGSGKQKGRVKRVSHKKYVLTLVFPPCRFKVFRAQLPRENAYYPPSSSSDDDDDVDNEDEERGEEKTSGAKPTLQKGHGKKT